MNQATFHFYGELNDFLPDLKKDTPVHCSFNSDQSVKHLIEAEGVPHTEVGRILANGAPVDTNYLVDDGDQITVYPLAEDGCLPLKPDEARFVLDNHLGRLAGTVWCAILAASASSGRVEPSVSACMALGVGFASRAQGCVKCSNMAQRAPSASPFSMKES